MHACVCVCIGVWTPMSKFLICGDRSVVAVNSRCQLKYAGRADWLIKVAVFVWKFLGEHRHTLY